MKLFGKLVCWWKDHHIDGHKRKLNPSEMLTLTNQSSYVYECSRCGRLKDAPYPVKRKKSQGD